jgi:hypothetical protein
MQEPGQYTRGSLPQCERSVKESLSFPPGVTLPASGSRSESGIPGRGLHGQRHCLFSVPPGVTFFVTKESNQRKSCEIESPEGRPGKAGSGLRDFDGTNYALKEASKSQILSVRPHHGFVSISRTMFDRPATATKAKHRNHETCLCPLAMCIAIAQTSDSLQLGHCEFFILGFSTLPLSPPPLVREGDGLSANLKGGGESSC